MLLRATMRLKLKSQHTARRTLRIDALKLKTDAKVSFQIAISNRFSLLEPKPNPHPENDWQTLKTVTVEVASKHLGTTHRRQRD